MKLRLDKSNILYYASQYADDDTPIENLVHEVKKKRYLKTPELLELSDWKAGIRNRHYIIKNRDSVIEEMTNLSLTAETEEARINCLRCLAGVELPVASAILHWFHNDDYPIYDFRALETISFKKNHYKNWFDGWKDYISFCRRIAEENDIDMRTLDRALWQYSKEKGLHK